MRGTSLQLVCRGMTWPRYIVPRGWRRRVVLGRSLVDQHHPVKRCAQAEVPFRKEGESYNRRKAGYPAPRQLGCAFENAAMTGRLGELRVTFVDGSHAEALPKQAVPVDGKVVCRCRSPHQGTRLLVTQKHFTFSEATSAHYPFCLADITNGWREMNLVIVEKSQVQEESGELDAPGSFNPVRLSARPSFLLARLQLPALLISHVCHPTPNS